MLAFIPAPTSEAPQIVRNLLLHVNPEAVFRRGLEWVSGNVGALRFPLKKSAMA
jgi:hypothetical protein